jgi:two-component system, OmpR family, sensor kinase
MKRRDRERTFAESCNAPETSRDPLNHDWHKKLHRKGYRRPRSGPAQWLRYRAFWQLRRKIFSTILLAVGLTIGGYFLATRILPERLRVSVGVPATFVLLWFVSGKAARRLSAPVDGLVEVAEALGRGDLSARARTRLWRGAEADVLGDAMNRMAERIEKQVRDQRALLAMVSHELRTPFSRIRLLTEFAREQDTEARKKTLEEVDREIECLDALVSDLLASSRIDFAARDRSRLEPTALALRALETAHVDASILEVESGVEALEGDATLLVRALVNLLENARRYAKGATRLHISRLANVGTPQVVFAIEDRGSGIPESDRQAIFQPFYRVHNAAINETTDAKQSVGLGLSLVARIAEAHGGVARVANAQSGGARFEIVIPTVN